MAKAADFASNLVATIGYSIVGSGVPRLWGNSSQILVGAGSLVVCIGAGP
jgi:hypothetical protein|tara:strand:+ start:1519 stop:1668 length:150 start_codon:yes stop_codon:yes gene_type:complete